MASEGTSHYQPTKVPLLLIGPENDGKRPSSHSAPVCSRDRYLRGSRRWPLSSLRAGEVCTLPGMPGALPWGREDTGSPGPHEETGSAPSTKGSCEAVSESDTGSGKVSRGSMKTGSGVTAGQDRDRRPVRRLSQ